MGKAQYNLTCSPDCHRNAFLWARLNTILLVHQTAIGMHSFGQGSIQSYLFTRQPSECIPLGKAQYNLTCSPDSHRNAFLWARLNTILLVHQTAIGMHSFGQGSIQSYLFTRLPSECIPLGKAQYNLTCSPDCHRNAFLWARLNTILLVHQTAIGMHSFGQGSIQSYLFTRLPSECIPLGKAQYNLTCSPDCHRNAFLWARLNTILLVHQTAIGMHSFGQGSIQSYLFTRLPSECIPLGKAQYNLTCSPDSHRNAFLWARLNTILLVHQTAIGMHSFGQGSIQSYLFTRLPSECIPLGKAQYNLTCSPDCHRNAFLWARLNTILLVHQTAIGMHSFGQGSIQSYLFTRLPSECIPLGKAQYNLTCSPDCHRNAFLWARLNTILLVHQTAIGMHSFGQGSIQSYLFTRLPSECIPLGKAQYNLTCSPDCHRNAFLWARLNTILLVHQTAIGMHSFGQGSIQSYLFTRLPSECIPLGKAQYNLTCSPDSHRNAFLWARLNTILLVHQTAIGMHSFGQGSIQSYLFTRQPSECIPLGKAQYNLTCSPDRNAFLWARLNTILLVHQTAIGMHSFGQGSIQSYLFTRLPSECIPLGKAQYNLTCSPDSHRNAFQYSPLGKALALNRSPTERNTLFKLHIHYCFVTQ